MWNLDSKSVWVYSSHANCILFFNLLCKIECNNTGSIVIMENKSETKSSSTLRISVHLLKIFNWIFWMDTQIISICYFRIILLKGKYAFLAAKILFCYAPFNKTIKQILCMHCNCINIWSKDFYREFILRTNVFNFFFYWTWLWYVPSILNWIKKNGFYMFTIYKSYNVIGHEKLDRRKVSFLEQRFCFFFCALMHLDSIMTIRTTLLINSIQS